MHIHKTDNSEDETENQPIQSPRYQKRELEEDDVDAQLSQSSDEHPSEPAKPSASKRTMNVSLKRKPQDMKGVTYRTVAVDEDKDFHDELTQHVPM
jgi:hypothetical protein